jgi:3-aminoavenalumate diazotase
MLGLPTLMTDDRSGRTMAAAINEFRPTIVVGFPATLAEFAVDHRGTDAAEVHTWMGMGDASHERHIRPLVALGRHRSGDVSVAGSTYIDGLGSSEMGMVLFRVAHTMHTENYDRMIGRPVDVVRDVAVFDDNGNRLSRGAVGHLGVLTPSSTPGYCGDEELTSLSRVGDYLLTGDVVREAENGVFYHLDRSPDVIRSVDGPVYSLELEEVVLIETRALDAAVIAVDDPANPGASRPFAVALFTAHPEASVEDLLNRCNAELARRDLPVLKGLMLTTARDALPVGVTGKVLKRVMRERHVHELKTPVARVDVALAQTVA